MYEVGLDEMPVDDLVPPGLRNLDARPRGRAHQT